jgi:hypothetical protein
MKTEYNIKDTVWIHIGERKLVKGRVVEIIDLEHLDEGYSKDNEFYIIEIPTYIEPIYEVRSADMISETEEGPIGAFREVDGRNANRYLKKIGMPVPDGVEEWADEHEPTPEQIHAAIERSQGLNKHDPLPTGKKAAPKKRFYKKKPTKA